MMKTFLDTNILIYSVDKADPSKQETAIGVIAEHASEQSGVISTQVLQEFYSAATRKLGIPPAVAKKHVQDFQIFDIVQISPDMIERGIDASILYKISFWDGLIIAAACAANSTILLTEDLNDGQFIEGITVQNPFQ